MHQSPVLIFGKMPIKEDYGFTSKMPDNLVKLRKDRIFCDVILRSGLREIYAHRIILTMLSDYFTVLFKYEGGFEKPAIEYLHHHSGNLARIFHILF
jgi:hypothetical protein